MHNLFSFLSSVLFVMIRAFLYSRVPGSQRVEVEQIIAETLVIYVLCKLMIWTIRKGKGWLILSIGTGVFLWSVLRAGSSYGETFSSLSNLFQMLAFIFICFLGERAFMKSSSSIILIALLIVAIVGFGYSMYSEGTLFFLVLNQ